MFLPCATSMAFFISLWFAMVALTSCRLSHYPAFHHYRQKESQLLMLSNREAKLHHTSKPGGKIGVATSFEPTAKLVYELLDRVANHSWEWGAQAQVILEMQYPDLSVYSNNRKLPLSSAEGPLSPPSQLLRLLERVLSHRVEGSLPLVDGEGAAGDPASLGVAVLVAAATTKDDTSKRYTKLANDQLDWLFYHVPHSPEGAISQRDKELQYWSDYMFMAPPFLAWHGAMSGNMNILRLAYDQARLYRNTLRDDKLQLWRHILKGSFEDWGLWSTGNGWAAAGMMRIYATFDHLRDPSLRAQTAPWRHDLAEWVLEIVNRAYEYQYQDTYLLPNYFATNDRRHNYAECSGTALIASAGYRLASLDLSYAKRLPIARLDQARTAIFTKYTNSNTGAVSPVVDPGNWLAVKALNGTQPENTFVSPEGQAFVLMLHEAWKAYVLKVNSH